MRTPLGRVRGLGSAKDGTGHFWHQRITAVANLPLVILFLIVAVSMVGASHSEVVALLSSPLVAILMTLGMISISYHMYLGMQVVIEDYVHGEGSKILLVLGNIFFCAFVGLSSIFAIFKLSFGG